MTKHRYAQPTLSLTHILTRTRTFTFTTKEIEENERTDKRRVLRYSGQHQTP
jgi:hypothetical protein